MGEKDLGRRDFIRSGVLLGTAAIASTSLFGCAPSAQGGTKSASNASEMSWDKEADAIVVGSGTGLYTALRLDELGLKTILVEKSDIYGGSTVFSSSVVWAPNNAVMQSKGDKDSREEALAYIKAGGGETYAPEIAEAFVDNINTAVEGVTRLSGVEWTYWGAGIDYRSNIEGGKQIGRALIPVVADNGPTAGVLGGKLIDAVDASGVEGMKSTTLKDLVVEVDEDGKRTVTGVIVDSDGTTMSIKANKGVVLAAGGFDWNQEMMQNYLRVPARYSWGMPNAKGEVHMAAMRAGAAMKYMNESWLSPGYRLEYEDSFSKQSAHLSQAIRDYWKRGLIYVNKHGRRFVNETANYDSIGRTFGQIESGIEPRGWKNLPAFAICDQACVDAFGVGGAKGKGDPGLFTRYDSLEALADACGIDKEGLLDEVARFNDNAAQGLDPDFGRGQDYYGQNYPSLPKDYEPTKRALAPISTPPFYAAEVVPVVLGTMGGVKVNANAQAVDENGDVITGLYAQGNNAGVGCGSAFYAAGGGTLGPGLTFGEIAATHMAQA